MLKDNFLIAFRNLSHRRLRSWLTMIGIFIGIAAVVSLIGLGQGLKAAIMSQFDFLGPNILSVQASGMAFSGPPGTGAVNPLKDNLAEKIKKIKGVEASYNRYIKSAKIGLKNKQVISVVASVPMGKSKKAFEEMLNLKASKGRLLKDIDNKKVVVGSRYLNEEILGKRLEVGDKITINGISFEVSGILEKKGNFMLDRALFINENVLKDVFGDDGTVDLIAIKVSNEKDIPYVKKSIEKLLRKERHVKEGEEDFQVESPQNIIKALNDTLGAVNIFVVIIASISLLVGGIGIMNTMYTSVVERKKEIGIMKAIGARNSRIFKLFFIESGFLGMAGGIIGIILGMILAYGMSFLGRAVFGISLIQAKIPLLLVVFSLAFSFCLGTLFGVFPALQAAKLQPVECLRSK